MSYASLNDGLVAYYPFNGDANDASGKGNNGIIYNATFVQGISGSGLQFTGNLDSYVEVPDNGTLSPSQAVTVSLWAKKITPSPAYSSLIYKAASEPIGWCGDRQYTLWTTSSQGLHLTSTPEGSTSQIYTTSPAGLYVEGQFFHVVGVVDASNHIMKIYVNGIEVQEYPYSGDQIRSGNYPLRIGGHFHYMGDQFNFGGIIDEVRIYNRALSDSEVQQLYGMNSTISAFHFGLTSNSGYASEPVNTALGNYTYEHTDLKLAGNPVLEFKRAYNSQDAYNGLLRYRWTHSYNVLLSVPDNQSAVVKYADGHVEQYTANSDGTFAPAIGGIYSTPRMATSKSPTCGRVKIPQATAEE
jgi:hypothetical protein